MKIFIIGGVTVKRGVSGFDDEVQVLKKSMEPLGAELVSHGHEVVVCSPFPDSADFHVLHGIAASSKDSHLTVSIHYPELPAVETALIALLDELGLSNVRRFPCRVGRDSVTSEALQYAWLFAQLNAMDSSAGVIIVGGKPSGSLSLLLHLADARNKGVLPLTFLGGAARDHFDATYWRLRDLIPNDLSALNDPSAITSIPSLLETILTGSQGEAERTFFISYARARPQEADYVETLLRRRNHIVYRDEENFEPSADAQAEIIKNIKRASVFVALWCREYACSPWCFDEIEIGLERHSKGLAELWIFCIDDTRIVPKAARTLNYYPVNTREKLEGKILFLLTKLEEREADQGAPADAAKQHR
jgi:hypothetical protein